MSSIPPGRDDSQLPPAEADARLATISVSVPRGTQSSVSTSADQQPSTAASTQSLRVAVNDNTALGMICQTPSDTTQAFLPVLTSNTTSTNDNASDSGSEMGEIREHSHLDEELYRDNRIAYQHGPEEPPVTPESLQELDPIRIFANAKLRADVNFDRDLHFRPDVEGSRGKTKIKASKEFWKAVDYELCYIGKVQEIRAETNEPAVDDSLKNDIRNIGKRLPKVLTAVRDILVSLVPEREQAGIKDELDVDFIMQQIINGVCDFRAIVTWLATTIKTHCAPMRDESVDKMQLTVTAALDVLDNSRLADGLRQLVDLMEAMKLDVANHQIRYIRPILIKDTVRFQRDYSRLCIQTGKIEMNKALAWLQSELDLIQGNMIPLTPLDALCSALLWDMVSPQGDNPYQQTFHLDYDRLKALSSELRSTLYRTICLKNLEACLPSTAGDVYICEATKRFSTFLTVVMLCPEWQTVLLDDLTAEIVQLVRSAPGAVINNLSKFERDVRNRLRRDLRVQGEVFAREKAQLFHRIVPKVQQKVKDNVDFEPLKLHDIFLPPIFRPSRPIDGFGAILLPPMPVVVVDEDSHVVNRLSHIICLHWQVFGDLYLANTNHEYQDGPPADYNAGADDDDDDNSMYADLREHYGAGQSVGPFERDSTHAEDVF